MVLHRVPARKQNKQIPVKLGHEQKFMDYDDIVNIETTEHVPTYCLKHTFKYSCLRQKKTPPPKTCILTIKCKTRHVNNS